MNFFAKDNISKRAKIGEGIYLLYFAVMIGARAAGLYEGMTIYNILLVLGMMLFAVKMVVTCHTIREYIIAFLLLALAGVVYLHTGEKGLLVCFTMLLGMKMVSVKKVISVGIIVSGVFILGKIVLGVFGILPEVYYPQVREGAGLMFRHALGYAHPNTLHMNVLMLSMLVMFFITKYVARDNIKLVLTFSVITFGFNYYVFMYSGSRTGILTCTVYLLINIWFYVRKTPGNLEKIVCYAAFPAVCFISIAGPFLLPKSIFEAVDNKIFTTRFTIARYFWSNNSLSLFGIRLNNPKPRYMTYGLDMAQLYLFLQLGLTAFCVVSVITMLFIYASLKKNRMQELAVLLAMLCLGIWEPLLYNLGFKNFVYVFMGAILYEVLAEKAADNTQTTDDGSENDRVFAKTVLTAKVITRSLALGIAMGVAGAFVYLALTGEPSALYGNRQQDETGKSFDMEELYFSPDEIESLKAEGNIVIGYAGEELPMYRYDAQIASMEYEKRVVSTGVWCFVIVAALYVMCYTIWDNLKRRNK